MDAQMIRQYGLSEADWNLTVRSFEHTQLDAGDFFLEEGNVSDAIGFVKSGLLRAFVYDEDGDEVTTHFFQPGMLVISADSFNNRVPATENVVAISASELAIIRHPKLLELYKAIPVWPQICKDIADRKNNELINRSLRFQTLSATERYRQFCRENPMVVKYAALRHIASYLGIDIATLSRIRKKK